MYNELIANLRNCAEVNSLSWYKRGLMKRAADAIEELSRENESLAKSVNEASEIPVTERLPEDGQRVLAFTRAAEGGMSMSEVVIRAVSAILTTIGLMAINSGHISIGYPLFGTGLFWLTYRESK